jgi:membrane fusion protein, multidrug efflux system
VTNAAFRIGAIALSLFAVSCTNATQARDDHRPKVQAHTETLRLTTVTDEFQAPGTIRAKTQTVLSSKVVGQITALPVREGDRVRKGQVLVEIEGRDASAQLRRAQAAETEARKAMDEVDSAVRAADAGLRTAEANRDLALATRKRYDILRERRSVSPQEFEEVDTRHKAAASEAERARQNVAEAQSRRAQVLARIEQAEAEVEAARVALGYLTITAPIDGVVTAKKAEPGMLASPGMPLLAIDDDSNYELDSIVEESRVASVRPGQTVRVEIDAVDATVDAKVREIVPASDPATRTYIVKLDLALTPSLRGNVHSGFYGRASFAAGQRQALIAPESAFVERGQLIGVYVVKDNVASLRLVKTGKRYDKGIEILSGLNPDSRIVTAPHGEIADGVEIVETNREGMTP